MRNVIVFVVHLRSIAAATARRTVDKPVRVAGGLVAGIPGRDASVEKIFGRQRPAGTR